MKGLMVAFWQLKYASGIDERILKKDIKNGVLKARYIDDEELFLYSDVLEYAFSKWDEGKTKMYDPYGDRELGFSLSRCNGISSSILDKMSDGFTPAQLKSIPKLDKNGIGINRKSEN